MHAMLKYNRKRLYNNGTHKITEEISLYDTVFSWRNIFKPSGFNVMLKKELVSLFLDFWLNHSHNSFLYIRPRGRKLNADGTESAFYVALEAGYQQNSQKY